MTLDKIEKEAGVSVWSCGQRMLLKELNEGLEANKHELSRLTATIPQHFLTVVLLSCYSCIVETDLSYANYKAEVQKLIRENGNSKMGKYCSDKLLLDTPHEELDISLLLLVDMQYSVIDLFNSVEKVLPGFYKNSICDATLGTKFMEFSILQSNLFENLHMIATNSFDRKHSEEEINVEVYNILELYTVGNYFETARLAKKYLNENPRDFQISTILCKALLNADLPFPCDLGAEYIAAIYSIYRMDKNCHRSVSMLQKELKYNYGSTLCTKIQAFLFRKHLYNGDEAIVFCSSLLDEPLHPNFARYLGNAAQNFLAKCFSTLSPISAKMVGAQLTGDLASIQSLNISKKRMLFFCAEVACFHGAVNTAFRYIGELEPLCRNDNLYEKERISRIKLMLFSQEKDYYSAIHLLVDAFFISESLFNRLANGKYFELPSRIRNQDINKDVYYCVLLYLLDRSDYRNQIVAYNNLLDLNGYTGILEALATLNSGAEKAWIFFFYEVCTISLLKRDSRLYRENIPPETVRIEILQKLLFIQNHKKYTHEINDILTAETLRDKLNTINKSRIHVDVDKILRSKEALWSETYRKYLASRDFKSEVLNANFADIDLPKMVDQFNYELSTIPQILQQTVVLRSLIEQMIDEFLFSTQYGLETYVSSRIRHGYCKGQLMNFLEELHLISMRNGNHESIYSINKYWDEQVNEQTASYLRIKQELSSFTEEIETKVEEVRTKWLRIKYKEPSFGMFDYSELSNVLNLCAVINQREPIFEFSTFYRNIVNIFWKYTDISLKKIRERISHELTQFYIDAIDSLEHQLKSIASDPITNSVKQRLLNNCNVAKSEVVAAMEGFKGAFSRNNNHYVNFTMHELTKSCQKVLEKQCGKKDNIVWEIVANNDFVFDGMYFTPFVDVLCILLNNSLSHSETDKDSRLTIRIEIDEMGPEEAQDAIEAIGVQDSTYDHVFYLQVENTLGPHVDSRSLKQKLTHIFDEINKEKDNRQQVQQEGGSGLFKLCNTIQYNIEAPYYVGFEVEPGKVCLRYCFLADQLLVKEVVNENSYN